MNATRPAIPSEARAQTRARSSVAEHKQGVVVDGLDQVMIEFGLA